MTHLEEKEAVVRHLRAKLQGNRKDSPEAGRWPESRSAASPAMSLGQSPVPGSKGELPPEPPWTRRVDFSRAPPSHSKGQGVGQHSSPRSICEPPGWTVRLKKGISQDASFHSAPAKPGGGDALNKEVGATSHPPQRNPAQQTWPLAKDKGAPVVPAKGIAAAAPLDAAGSSRRTGHPAVPRRKPLPHVKVLGVRPAKPRRPPVVDLEKFGVAAHPGTPLCPAVEPPRSTQLGKKRGYVTSALMQFPPQDAPSVTGDEDELYDDVEPAGLLGRGKGFQLSPISQPPVYRHPGEGFGFTGGDAGQASNSVALLAAAQREAQVSRKMKPMTLKDCKKEEKADREFQKKFKFEGNINVLTRMMVDPAATEKRGGGKNLPLRRGEILDVIQFTNQEQILCRNSQRRYGYVPRAVMLHLDADIYDDVEIYGRCRGNCCQSPFTKHRALLPGMGRHQ
ncbi:PML-RARA-regulated adapter molecule 1 isoform X1 [Falco cherrug]|uniref:PML-RARA-regulated adapter molecule 1 isoform X1 n=2 Tax=Falco cherrug TaxID=345164 RepID=UPI0024783660|nr:PML-RARA-regulated adapter molecule 1 isoform X1 [Falco cherrug]XP_055564354.1 PML-RARA-regulated adapter molecule 1 isoform X1 [Falco cherrug]